MKGIINKGIQEFVETKFGAETWKKITALAECEEPFFAISEDYPDEMTIALVEAASQISELPVKSVMIEFGKFVLLNTFKNNYPTYYALAGSSAKEFLFNMNRVHSHVTESIPGAIPPKFECEELSDGRLLMHYHSERGLCSVLHGLILGVENLFNENLQVQETACFHQGDSHCIMEITFL